MNAYVIFSSREPVLIVTRQAIRSRAILNQLGRVGIQKFIAREVPVGHLRKQYGRQFEIIEEALQKGSDLRVLDFSGRRIFQKLPFSDFGRAYRHDHPMGEAEPTSEPHRKTSRLYSASDSPSVFG